MPAHLQAAERQPPLCGWPGGVSPKVTGWWEIPLLPEEGWRVAPGWWESRGGQEGCHEVTGWWEIPLLPEEGCHEVTGWWE